ncbi:MAG TPA: hypothetical protein VNM90_21045 [Haliangium sp.]|nr:hypothetical protein [Haliangium sp.]
MQTLTKKTPVPVCLSAAGFTIRMMTKYPESPTMTELAPRLGAGRTELAQSERAVADAEEALMLARVDVMFEDHASDRYLRRLQNQAQSADGHKGGRISTTLFPDGLSEITRRQGPTQVKRMRELEGRLEPLTTWPEAMTHLAGLIVRRTSYEGALDARTEAERVLTRARATRDAAKERFLDLYAEIAGRIASEFPRNRRMQDLFFDTIRTRTRAGAEQPDETLPGEPDAGDDGAL